MEASGRQTVLLNEEEMGIIMETPEPQRVLLNVLSWKHLNLESATECEEEMGIIMTTPEPQRVLLNVGRDGIIMNTEPRESTECEEEMVLS
ncbi:hypothetical protein J6590_005092 [Homalodisca vitripennis]|nr:hypothetical protein J6590_005092 [Homalodisca vitripennis]